MIEGSVVAVTGASGRATALHLAAGGAKEVLGAGGENGLAALADEIMTGAVGLPILIAA
jgi:NADP-dependent 3-hydroxy acid dehydrogenase YdfG